VHQKKVVAADLRQEKFILMHESHCLGAQAQQFCQSKGFKPRISCRSAQVGTVLAMVKAGLGISLIPEMAREHGLEEGIVYRSLDGTRPVRAIVLAVSTQRKPARGTIELSRFIRENAQSTQGRR
jgi:LysR family hydrogen peroxide-inducible transcriptional activator